MVGIGSAYKSFGIIILIAYAAVYVVKAMRDGKKNCLLAAAGIFLAFGGYHLAEKAVVRGTERAFNISIQAQAPYPHFFLVGLNTQAEGQIHLGSISRSYVNEYQSNGFDADAAKKHAFETLRSDWQQNTGLILPNFVKKMIWAWQDDQVPFYYFQTSIGLKPDTGLEQVAYRAVCSYMVTAGQFYYMGLMCLASLWCFFYSRKNQVQYCKEFCMLIIFGYFCLMLLSEAQSRYKCLVLPYICILAACGGAASVAGAKGWISLLRRC